MGSLAIRVYIGRGEMCVRASARVCMAMRAMKARLTLLTPQKQNASKLIKFIMYVSNEIICMI